MPYCSNQTCPSAEEPNATTSPVTGLCGDCQWEHLRDLLWDAVGAPSDEPACRELVVVLDKANVPDLLERVWRKPVLKVPALIDLEVAQVTVTRDCEVCGETAVDEYDDCLHCQKREDDADWDGDRRFEERRDEGGK